MKKISTIWLSGCSGCHMSLLDIDEKLIELTSEAKIVKSTPIVDIKNFPQADIGIVEGAVATKEDEENLKKIRECCKILVAIGDCACFGGITSYRNLFEKEEVLQRVFIESESVEKGKIPQSKFVPPILEKVKPINAVVTVDCYIPGCPPNAKVIFYALKELLAGRIPVLPSEMVSFE
ncbi:MAG: NADP oxidoreductase [Candidatus Bathyarchaeia archaeon]